MTAAGGIPAVRGVYSEAETKVANRPKADDSQQTASGNLES